MKQLWMEYQKIDSSIIKLMKSGIKFCFGMIILSTLFLLAYDLFYSSSFTYYIGISLFKTSLFFMTFFIICGVSCDKIIKDLKK